MLRDGIFHYLTLVGNGIELDLLGVLHELRYDNREVFRHFGSHAEETLKLLVVVADVHRSTRKDVRRTHEHREAHLGYEVLDVVHAGEGTPCRLVDAELVEHCRELVAVLCTVDVEWRCAEHRHSLTMELHREVVRNLSAHRNDDASWRLKVDYVEHALKRELVEIETVAHVIVGRYGLRVVVDHDRLVALLASGIDGIDRTPVELNR